MSAPLDAAWLPALAALAAKATLVLLATAGAAALLARGSAAARHLAWCLGICGVLALPLLAAVLPAWELPLLPAAGAPAGSAGEAALHLPGVEAGPLPAAPAPSGFATRTRTPAGDDLSRAALAVAAAGVLAGVLWLALGFWGAARVGRRAEVVRDPAWLHAAGEAADRLGLRRPVLLLRSRGPAMPATWGLLWPSVVLPASADRWSDELRRAVLAHELAHVKRFDCLTQALAQLACVLFWWHPGVWYAARRLRVERERACDDLVLGAGARASDYAAHLLEIARTHRSTRLAAPAMVSMAKPSHLESRLLWVLDAARPRTAPSAARRAAAVAAALLVVGPLAAMRAVGGSAPPAPAPGYAAETGIAGLGPLGAAQLASLRAVGVDGAYVKEMKAAGLGRLSVGELVALRAVGVTAEYLAELRRHGVSPRYAGQAKGLRAAGVTGAYVEEMRALGLGPLDAETLTQLRELDVTPAYVRELEAAGLRGLSAAAVAERKAHDLTAARAREREGAGREAPDRKPRVRARTP